MDAVRRKFALEALGLSAWSRRVPAGPIRAEQPVEDRAAVAFPAPASSAVKEPQSAPAVAPDAGSIPRDWAGLREAVAVCTRCKLSRTRHNTVFGVGPENAPLLLIGEGPGADEDARGEPFVGRAGKLLDEMLKAIGRSRRDSVYIANVVKCRPPGNRDPEADEVASCRPYLEQQIRLLRPRLIVGLGRVAAQRLLATDLPMSKLRGGLHHYGPESTPLMLTYHPAYLLRSPREKAKAWEDLKRIERFLAEAPA